jgi:hypothetical protein
MCSYAHVAICSCGHVLMECRFDGTPCRNAPSTLRSDHTIRADLPMPCNTPDTVMSTWPHEHIIGVRGIMAQHRLRPLRGRNSVITSHSTCCDPSGVSPVLTWAMTPEGSQHIARRALAANVHSRPRRARLPEGRVAAGIQDGVSESKPLLDDPINLCYWTRRSGYLQNFPRTPLMST